MPRSKGPYRLEREDILGAKAFSAFQTFLASDLPKDVDIQGSIFNISRPLRPFIGPANRSFDIRLIEFRIGYR